PRAKAAGVKILVPPYKAGQRDATMVQFTGGYIAELHSVSHQQKASGASFPSFAHYGRKRSILATERPTPRSWRVQNKHAGAQILSFWRSEERRGGEECWWWVSRSSV